MQVRPTSSTASTVSTAGAGASGGLSPVSPAKKNLNQGTRLVPPTLSSQPNRGSQVTSTKSLGSPRGSPRNSPANSPRSSGIQGVSASAPPAESKAASQSQDDASTISPVSDAFSLVSTAESSSSNSGGDLTVGDLVTASLPPGAAARLSITAKSLSLPQADPSKAEFRGTVRFVGSVEFATGTWVGIELEEAKGKNDGCVKGVRYFQCKQYHGLFCRPSLVHRIQEREKSGTRTDMEFRSPRQSLSESDNPESKDKPADPEKATPLQPGPLPGVQQKNKHQGQGKLDFSNYKQDNSDYDGSIVAEDEMPIEGVSPEVTVHLPEGEPQEEPDDAVMARSGHSICVLPRACEAGSRWAGKVDEMAYRGIHLAYILDFYQKLATGTLQDAEGNQLMTHFNPECHTTNDVVRQAIIPASKGTVYGDCAYSTYVQGNQPTLATVMVSHHWKNLFCHMVAAMISFALGDTSYETVASDLSKHKFEELRIKLDRRDALKMAFWGCLFCVNQHVSICGGLPPEPLPGIEMYESVFANYLRDTTDPITKEKFQVCMCSTTKHWNDSEECEMDKFDAMMAVLNVQAPKISHRLNHVIVVDKTFEVFSRIWVMAEIAKGQELELCQTAMLFSGSGNLSAKEIGRVRETMDIRQCTASRKEDVDAILAGIPDVDLFNERLQSILFNSRTGLLETWSAERCAGFFDVIDPLKDLFSDLSWHAPQVITIGQESTGKSTLMERLTGIPVFPRDADLCTRAVIKVRLRRGPAQDPRLIVEDLDTSHEESSRRVKREALGEEVLREMTRQVRLEALRKQYKGDVPETQIEDSPLEAADGICTQKIIIVELMTPSSPNLDIADCPGLVAARSRGRPVDVVSTTADLVRRYAQEHRQNALFLVTVKASEQPNNSLAMQLVQDLNLEERTLCVLTMTDMLTGDLTDKDCKLQKAFTKHHGPRMYSMLRNETDIGGSVHLGLGYILTALNDISESKGWANVARVDAMAQWEQMFFAELNNQWTEQDSEIDQDLVKNSTSCNSVWRHVKHAVDDFVKNHWLEDTFNLVQHEESETAHKEKSLGLPRALAIEDVALLQQSTDMLPGDLRLACQVAAASDTALMKQAFKDRAVESLCTIIDEVWNPGGLFKNIGMQLEDRIGNVIPEKITVGRGTAAPKGRSSFDIGGAVHQCFLDIEAALRESMADVAQKLLSGVEEALKFDESPAKLGRLERAIVHLMSTLRRHLADNPTGCDHGSLSSLRTVLGIASGCGLDSTPWVKIDRGAGFTFTATLIRTQIISRCALVFHQYLDIFTATLPELVQKTCEELPDDIWVENCSQQRYRLLEHLQKLRTSLARLREAFSDDIRALEDQMARTPTLRDAVATVAVGGDSPARQGFLKRMTEKKLKSTVMNVIEKQREGKDARHLVRKTKLLRPNTIVIHQKRTPAEVEEAVTRWRAMLCQRAWDFFPSPEMLEQVLRELALGTDKTDDPVVGHADHCMRWHGDVSRDGTQASLQLVRPGEGNPSPAYANRLLAFLFASNDVFDQLESLPTKEPFTMACGDQLCVNLTHLRHAPQHAAQPQHAQKMTRTPSHQPTGSGIWQPPPSPRRA
eukprot:TRINITY_DN14981_c0_g1_i1.p1 TRINITY_DN14981_c0_g1~~TRINITY_DN14981_c0_g1_i1.p1  ORF type:complete len:1589 (-),score=374.84 TRINITY_DN14981_c0_g1_i1:70-4836(-)